MKKSAPKGQANTDTLCVNTIRTLAMDGVQAANSGHPGAPMGLAAAAYVLWTRFLRHNPKNPHWINRDRFVLSGGHASMLLYSMLFLTGYKIGMNELKNFRQWGSITPGHPEYGHTPGVETTTGPLGQGFGNAVGMAMAERHLAAVFNQGGQEIVDHYTYIMCGDGDLMEGLTSEAASLAGHLGLGKLICIYDDNKISIEGGTELAFTENVAARFRAYNWQVLRVNDGNDLAGIEQALKDAQTDTGKPSLIVLRTHIAYGSPNKQDTHGAHGAPLGVEEIRLTKENLGWPANKKFYVPPASLKTFRKCVQQGKKAEASWQKKFKAFEKKFPELAEQWQAAIHCKPLRGWDAKVPSFAGAGPIATRSASGQVINGLAEKLPNLVGGSADLAPSNNTLIKSSFDFQKGSYGGRNIRFGVREHAMGSILSGMALHGGIRPYGGTFLVFADYCRPAIRLAALMKVPVTYVFTHDSVAVGEDGPTHQPVEHLAALRAIPGLIVIRPADATETAAAWRVAIKTVNAPVAMILSRQNLPVLDRKQFPSAVALAKGGYILADTDGTPDAILIGSGSEVHLCLAARERLAKKGVAARVVSMPSWELFERASKNYRDKVLPPNVTARVAVEAGISMGWERYIGSQGAVIGINRFGASAPGGTIMEKYGMKASAVAAKVMGLVKK
ncbi:transketolase [Alkalispirochaeta odontotermitis]|nr:transketolase [Alkalispirochaeta odontotermitis]CAB1082486.1 Transketolase (EC [Olavius algarvensis Delta 1 endosymbiont]